MSRWLVLGAVGLIAAACASAPEPLVSAAPLPVVAAASPAALTPRDPRIPAAAVQWRGYAIRTWRFYFALAEPPAILFGQVHQESRWRCEATSPVGAQGCAQFMPTTAVWIQTLLPAEVRAECPAASGCPTSAKWALAAASKFDWLLWKALEEIDAPSDRWAMALVSYNGGSGWMKRERSEARRRGRDAGRWWGEVEQVCLRAEWACRESRGYPVAIQRRWQPLYETWLTAG